MVENPQKFTHRFVFPEKDDIDTVPIQDVVMTLPHPTEYVDATISTYH